MTAQSLVHNLLISPSLSRLLLLALEERPSRSASFVWPPIEIHSRRKSKSKKLQIGHRRKKRSATMETFSETPR